jgi:hypothetical protein
MSVEPPAILRTIRQPNSAGGAQAEKKLEQEEAAKKPYGSLQEIGFFGTNNNGTAKGITVLAGDGAPTITEGWVKLAKIQRYQRTSITVPEGYDPRVLTVPILFNAIAKTKEREEVESNILVLEWMAGRRVLLEGEELTGEPPYVQVYSTQANPNNLTNLVPRQFQSETSSGRGQQLWWITGIAFDPNPIRDRGGERLRQAATVTLTEVVATQGAIESAERSATKAKNKYKTFTVTSAINTIRKIAQAEHRPKQWPAILTANPKLGSNSEKHLKPGTKVKIPLSIFQSVPK